jgi:hypothetical protein
MKMALNGGNPAMIICGKVRKYQGSGGTSRGIVVARMLALDRICSVQDPFAISMFQFVPLRFWLVYHCIAHFLKLKHGRATRLGLAKQGTSYSLAHGQPIAETAALR